MMGGWCFGSISKRKQREGERVYGERERASVFFCGGIFLTPGRERERESLYRNRGEIGVEEREVRRQA